MKMETTSEEERSNKIKLALGGWVEGVTVKGNISFYKGQSNA